MISVIINESLVGLRKADAIYKRVTEISNYVFQDDTLAEREVYIKELEFLLQGVKGTDAHMTIFNHKTYTPEVFAGHDEFWGPLEGNTNQERMVSNMALLNKEYANFPYESVNWFADILNKIPFEERVNMKIHHCCMRFTLANGKPICIFSQGMPIQVDEQRHFNYTLNYVQNIQHLIKKDFNYCYVRFAYGRKNQFVQTYHTNGKIAANRDFLSAREKEILRLIAEDFDTNQIAAQLFISNSTVGNHRSNMIERLGARDTTALVQLAKMMGII